MKKVLTLLTACIVVVAMLVLAVVPACAQTPKQKIISAVKENIPEHYVKIDLPIVENILSQVSVSEEQATEVIKAVMACKDAFPKDEGYSVHFYETEQIVVIEEQFDIVCRILGLTYEIVPSTTPDHEGDVVYLIYNGSKLIADVDFDVRRTDKAGSDVDYALIVMAVAALAGTVGAIVCAKKVAVR